ncbi:acyl carrier protein [Amycolatopsis sp. NPDC005961]|uniref:Acyl carrier protein n=1 Tax=Amycolatopsis camponoti TaxID=2606593 RepID=A0A6I8LG43_9PSEU|nr:acyl carrier protein [Amycolatopsis camponoti]VVJ16021.1 Acyl carrier protein [Amycolatopsis camponoti]
MTTDHASATFDVVAELLTELVGDVLGIEITPETTFHEDLQLESIDLVTFASILTEHFGAEVNLAEYLAEQDLDDVIGLTVGDIARFVGERTCRR